MILLSRRSVHGLLGNSFVRGMGAAILDDELKIAVCQAASSFLAEGTVSTLNSLVNQESVHLCCRTSVSRIMCA